MRDLTKQEMEHVLETQKIGRIALFDPSRDRPYVVPICYLYTTGAFHLHSAPGLKLSLLRARPAGICVQVDAIADIADWASVIAWGHYREETDPKRRQEILLAFGDLLVQGPLRQRQNLGRSGELGAGEMVDTIVIDEMTGRADGSAWMPSESD